MKASLDSHRPRLPSGLLDPLVSEIEFSGTRGTRGNFYPGISADRQSLGSGISRTVLSVGRLNLELRGPGISGSKLLDATFEFGTVVSRTET